MRNGDKDPALWTMEWAQAMPPIKEGQLRACDLHQGRVSDVFISFHGSQRKTPKDIS